MQNIFIQNPQYSQIVSQRWRCFKNKVHSFEFEPLTNFVNQHEDVYGADDDAKMNSIHCFFEPYEEHTIYHKIREITPPHILKELCTFFIDIYIDLLDIEEDIRLAQNN